MSTATQAYQQLNAFFETYANALKHYDTKAMAYLYNLPCTLISDETNMAFADMSKLEGFFNQGVVFYKHYGIASARPEIWSKHLLTGKIAHVKVNWKYMDGLNQPIYDCDYYYILKPDKHNQWKIILSVSVNEKQRAEEWEKLKGRNKYSEPRPLSL